MSQSELFNPDRASLQAEGAYLLAAERAADALERRVRSAHSSVKVFRFSRDELAQLASAFARVVAISRGYHLAEADRHRPVSTPLSEDQAA